MKYITGKFGWLIFILFFLGCSSTRLIKKTESRANVDYMPREASERLLSNQKDTVIKRPSVISFKRADSSMVYVMAAVWDSVSKEKMGLMKIEAVTVTGVRVRQVAERNGKINIDFIVSVPREMQRQSWQTNIYPFMRRGLTEADSLEAIQLTGDRFRQLQYKDYLAYEKYLAQIIPDSADFFDSYVNTGGFYGYLNGLNRLRERLNMRLTKQMRDRDKTLMLRFAEFNDRAQQLKEKRAADLIRRQQLILQRKSEAAAQATLRTVPKTRTKVKNNSSVLPTRFSLFNTSLEDMRAQYIAKKYAGKNIAEEDMRFPARFVKRDIPSFALFRKRVARKFENPLLESNRSNLGAWVLRVPLVERDTSELRDNGTRVYRSERKKALIRAQLRDLEHIDSASIVNDFINTRKIAHNEKLKAEADIMRNKLIPFPLRDGLRLDSVITTRDTLYYKYSQEVQADENTSKLYVYLNGDLVRRSGIFYKTPESDTLTFNVSSMVNFIDETPYYVQKIVHRDAEANSSFQIGFQPSKSILDENFENNSEELQKVKDMIAKLIKDPIYIIDSISVTAYSSPEGTFAINNRFSRERAHAFGEFMKRELKVWRDSLDINGSISVDASGEVNTNSDIKQQYPDLSKSITISSVAENWGKLTTLISQDENIKHLDGILDKIATVSNQDTRESSILQSFPTDYAYMRKEHYPKLRVVDVRFNLHRRGMIKDTVHTTELDSTYMEGVRLLKARKYEQALEILRPYDNVNTAVAYMSLGYDNAALRIFSKEPPTADIIYTMAILYARKNDTGKAVEHLMRAVEMKPLLRFRANLDPELSELVKLYSLFSDN